MTITTRHNIGDTKVISTDTDIEFVKIDTITVSANSDKVEILYWSLSGNLLDTEVINP